MIIPLQESQYIALAKANGIKPYWYGYPRGWTDGTDIFINADAFYFCNRDKKLLIQHEEEHINGKEHTMFGVMSPWGLVRLLTTF